MLYLPIDLNEYSLSKKNPLFSLFLNENKGFFHYQREGALLFVRMYFH